jgi:hypothetical protein
MVCTMVFSTPDKTLHRHSGLVRAQARRPAAAHPYQPGGLLSLGKPGLIMSCSGSPVFMRGNHQNHGLVPVAVGERLSISSARRRARSYKSSAV